MTAVGILLLGAATGVQYGLLAVGLVLIYRASRFVNFAQAQVGVFAALVVGRLVIEAGVPYVLAVPAGVATSAAMAALVERTVIQRIFGAPRLVLLVATIAVAQLMYGLTLFERGPFSLDVAKVQAEGYPVPFQFELTVGGVLLDSAQVLSLIVAPVIAVALSAYFLTTRGGRAVRAAASNPDAARLAGISVRAVSLRVWILAGVLSGLTAILVQPSQPAFAQAAPGPGLLLRGLAAAMLAGFVDFRLAFAGGVAVGVVEQTALYNIQSAGVGQFSVVLVVLVGIAWRGRTLAQSARDGEDLLVANDARVPLPRRLREVALARHLGLIGWGALFAGLALLPLIFDSTAQSTALIQILAFGMVGLSLTLLTGWAGQVSLGHFALVGVGAFVAAAVTESHVVAFPVAIVAAGGAAAVAAVIVGLPAVRFRGLFLAVTTLALAVLGPAWLFRQSFLGISDAARASVPLDVLRYPFGGQVGSYRDLYFIALAILALVVAGLAATRRSGFGRAMIAVRDNEASAAGAGLSTTVTKLAALTMSGAIAGVAGGVWATANSSFSFQSFDAMTSLLIVSVAIVGGLGTLHGPILGAFAVFAFPYLVSGQNTAFVRSMFSGSLLLAVVLFAPGGIAMLLQAVHRRTLGWLEAGLPDVPFGPVSDAPALVVRDVEVRFGGLTALKGVGMHVEAGEIVALIGGNGAGKSTLLNCVSGHLQPTQGEIELFGQRVDGLPPPFRRELRVARSFQDAGLFPGLTVLETVMVGLDYDDRTSAVSAFLGAPWALSTERRKRAIAEQALRRVGLSDRAGTLTSELSTGMRRLVELSAATVSGPRLLLLDEPTSGLAQREVEQFGPLIRRVRDEVGCAIVLIEHDMPLVMSLADRIYCLETGTVIAEGAPDEVQSDPRVIASYLGVDRPAIDRSGASELRDNRRRSRPLQAINTIGGGQS